MAAWTPPARCGALASPNPISTPHSVPQSMRSLKKPRWPMRNTLPASRPRPVPSDRSKRSSTLRRKMSASWPSGITIAVSESLYSSGFRHSISSAHARRERLLADGIEPPARRQHQALLRARDRHVDAPFRLAIVHRGERRNRVDHEQRRVPDTVDRLANERDAAGDARRGLVVHDHDGLVAVRLVRGEPGLHDHRIDAAPPIARDEVNLQPQPASHLAPQRGEVTGLEHEHG